MLAKSSSNRSAKDTTADRPFDAGERERLSSHANGRAEDLIREATHYGEYIAGQIDHMQRDRYRCR